jgi:potassium-transporting ATPase KdpC subunit
MISQLLPAMRATLVLAFYTGIVFPLVITLISQAICAYQANGSLLKDASGQVIGSELIGQSFIKPQYFHPRPSAAGAGYAGEASGGTNLGPTSKKLILGDKDFPGIKQLAVSYRQENGLDADALVPADAVTRSASGLDPHITPMNAQLQAPRVARARNLEVAKVVDLIRKHTEDRDWGFLGEPRVNVLQLNLALDNLH